MALNRILGGDIRDQWNNLMVSIYYIYLVLVLIYSC